MLANDTDPDNDLLTATLTVPPTLGQVVLNTDGSFDYTPTPGVTGTDVFTYEASDGQGGTVSETVTIQVEPFVPPNNPPVALSDSYTTTDNATLSVSSVEGVLANDTDPDNDPLLSLILI